jgi:biofilm PGA synthesis N-glycosyltransferase PgaC
MRFVVLVPAHDEQADVGDTLDSIKAQSRPADQIVVMCDNCTDRTAEIALEHGAYVMRSFQNTAKKAWALNRTLVGGSLA